MKYKGILIKMHFLRFRCITQINKYHKKYKINESVCILKHFAKTQN